MKVEDLAQLWAVTVMLLYTVMRIFTYDLDVIRKVIYLIRTSLKHEYYPENMTPKEVLTKYRKK